MTWLSRLGWAALAIASVGAVVAVYLNLVKLPEPTGAIVLDHASYEVAGAQPQPVALPHKTPRRRDAASASDRRYTFTFTLAAAPDEPLFLFIPAVNRPLSLILNGDRYFIAPSAPWSGPTVRRSIMKHLPRQSLRLGRNELTLVLTSGEVGPGAYLPKLYLGRKTALAPFFKVRVFLEDQLKTMALAAQILLGIGVVCAYFYRPRDPLLSWLAALAVIGSILSIGFFGLESIRPYVLALSPASGFLFIGVALALIGVAPPRWLRWATWLVPAISMFAVSVGLERSPHLAAAINIPIMIAGFAAATVIAARGALRPEGTEARLLLAPFFLSTCFLVRDVAVATGLDDGSLLLSFYVRPLFLAMVIVALMRRLALSLESVDRANETLSRRLAEQEVELAALHRTERMEAAQRVREQERRRLTHDLHDGISGHLVSIIAMTEQTERQNEPIQRVARQALDDLRLVIYSLDLGDRELPLALANFRERLIPQLQHVDVELDWSMADLPEITDVTPSNALSVLRILQEAITNALRHGPARRIAIHGADGGNGMAAITIENDGRPFVEGEGGFGLQNMRGRAKQLGGAVEIEALEWGAKVTLLLPHRLPPIEASDELEADAPSVPPQPSLDQPLPVDGEPPPKRRREAACRV